MNPIGTTMTGPHRPVDHRRRMRRALALAGVLLAVAVLVTACGRSSSKDPKTGSPGAGSGANSSQSAADAGLKYAQCMRAHGVTNFPESDSGPQTGPPINLSSPQYLAAQKACASLAPKGGGNAPTQNPQNQAQALKFAQCMRAHGVPNFPDPGSNGGFNLGPAGGSGGLDPNSPQFQKASQACQSLMPAGS